jgi:hypothetical protein
VIEEAFNEDLKSSTRERVFGRRGEFFQSAPDFPKKPTGNTREARENRRPIREAIK